MNKLKGLFLNTWKAQCSIYESGKMVYDALLHSEAYSLDYKEINEKNREIPINYDFFIFNYHQITMGWLDTKCVKKLFGLKATIVLEVLPNNPFVMCPKDDFDAYIVLDPTMSLPYGHVVAFPRPLEKAPALEQYVETDCPTIGTFGFATEGKGFDAVVEAVSKEFDKAIVRINIPVGTYTSGHQQEEKLAFARKMGEEAKKAARQGIEVVVTHDYMEKEELIRWCARNTLNCFLYNRNMPGLAATTDQAIVSGRPLAISANETFRHIHKYIKPYPFRSLRESIRYSEAEVAQMREDWKAVSFSEKFEREVLTRIKKKKSGSALPNMTYELRMRKSFNWRNVREKATEKIMSFLSRNLYDRSHVVMPSPPPVPYIHRLVGSFSQYGEDLFLDILFSEKKTGFYIDIGANHPEFGSNTKRFYERGWKGINIEPNLDCLERIKQDRIRDINLNIAVGKEKGKATFYTSQNDPTLSSLDPVQTEIRERTFNIKMHSSTVNVLPLCEIFEKYASDKKTDLLSVDAEGYDLEVLKSNDWSRWRPSVVMVEVFQQEKEVIKYMSSIGYLCIFNNYVNAIFIDNKNVDNTLNHIWNRDANFAHNEN